MDGVGAGNHSNRGPRKRASIMNALDRKTTMRRVDFYYFLTLSIVLLFIFGLPTMSYRNANPAKPAIIGKEQLASHLIVLKDGEGKEIGICTGTAIGPNAILTAEHCSANGEAKIVSIDEVMENRVIEAVAVDGRDHVILLIDGAPFRNIEKIKTAPAKVGEVVTMFGVGGGLYPPTPKYGKITDCQDPSDVDADAEISCATIPVIQGDSGSAIYNTKGEVVSVVTYMVQNSEAGFGLAFSQGILDAAASFSDKLIKK